MSSFFAHLFDSCTQDWYAVASILEDLLFKFKSTHPSISQVYLRSDEAGCYHAEDAARSEEKRLFWQAVITNNFKLMSLLREV